MLAAAPDQLAACLEAFIGGVPVWIAQVDAALTSSGSDGLAHAERACHELRVGAESVAADPLARLAEAVADSLARADRSSAQVFLAACEREYLEVFQEAFTLLHHISPGESSP
jgi:hypothetical protein